MSYIVDFDYYKQLKMCINRITNIKFINVCYKESMLNIHIYLMTHPTKTTFFISDFVYERMQVLQQYCEDYLYNNIKINNILDNNRFIVRFKISNIVCFYKYQADIQYKIYNQISS